ncbi:MAG: MFS transporter [Colwellia sp.]|nr:MFS transporter [Colwellia sp.]
MLLDRLLDIKNTTNVNSFFSVFTIVVLGVLSVVVLFVAPVLIGAMVSVLDFSEAQAGYVISAELAGMSLGTIIALYYCSRSNWRITILVALSLMIIGNLTSFYVQNFSYLIVCRFFVGIAAGVSMSFCIAIIGLTRNPDRIFAFWVTGQLLFGSVGLYILPNLFAVLGFNFVYLIVAILIFVLLFLLRFLPQHGKASEVSKNEFFNDNLAQPKFVSLFAYFGLVAIFVFYVGQYGIWTYLERMAVDAQIIGETIGKMLALATVTGVFGALSAAFLSAKYGRVLPILSGGTLSMIAMLILLSPINQSDFLVAICLFSFTFNFILPYLMACVANVDTSGKLIMITNISTGAGLAGGPALAGLLLEESSYDVIIWNGIMFTILSLILVSRLACYKIQGYVLVKYG